jgi:Spy/CpxP family protein refolding chaperone
MEGQETTTLVSIKRTQALKKEDTMMKRTLTAGAVLLLVGTLAVPVFAWGPGRWGGKGGYGPGACWTEGRPYGAATLSAEEQAEVDDLYRKHDEETAPLRERLRAKRAEMRALLAAESVDEARVREVRTEINGLRDDLSDKRTELQLALHKLDSNLRFAGRHGRGGYGHHRYGWRPGRHMSGGYGPGSGACWY